MIQQGSHIGADPSEAAARLHHKFGRFEAAKRDATLTL